MLAEIDYTNAFYKQYKELKQVCSEFMLFCNGTLGEMTESFQNILSDLNTILISQLLQTKGALAGFREEALSTEGGSVAETIELLANQLNLNIQLHAKVEELDELKSNHEIPGLKTATQVIAETIECLYAILRILKKVNLKKQPETSPLAEEAAKRSLHSIEKTKNGR